MEDRKTPMLTTLPCPALEPGFDVEGLEFDSGLVIRGLVIDAKLGNIVKVDRYGYVRKARLKSCEALHGGQMLSVEDVNEVYGRQRCRVDLRESRWTFINTLFSVANGCLFCQLVERADQSFDKDSPLRPDYALLARSVGAAVSEAHVDGILKERILEDPTEYVELDSEAPIVLLDQKLAGKRLVLITNNDWEYTRRMMSYAYDRYLPPNLTWRSLFDVVITNAQKPDFWTLRMPLWEVMDEERGLTHSTPRAKMKVGKVYCGGHAGMVEECFGHGGQQVMYVGDHIYADTNVAKSILQWQTCLIMRELEGEVRALAMSQQRRRDLGEMLVRRDKLLQQRGMKRVKAGRERLGISTEFSFGLQPAHHPMEVVPMRRKRFVLVKATTATLFTQLEGGLEAMAAIWLKRRRELAYMTNALELQRSDEEAEAKTNRIPKESSKVAAIRRQVYENSQTIDESDLEFLPKPTPPGSVVSQLEGPSRPASPQGGLNLSEPSPHHTASEGVPATPLSDVLQSPASPGSVSMGIARRRSSVNLREPLPDTEGAVIDFLERRRVIATKTFIVKMWQKNRGILTGDIVIPAYDELHLITQVLRAPQPDESLIVSECRFLMEVEELASAIGWITTRENKALTGPGQWPKTSSARFKEWVTSLMKMEKTCREMERQARASTVRFKYLYSGVHPTTPRDFSFQHRVRVVDFWYEYHKDAWNTKHPGLKRKGSAGSMKVANPGSLPPQHHIRKQLSTRRMMSRSHTSLLRDAGSGAVCTLPPVDNVTRERYLKLCNGLTATPLPIPFVIGETNDLDLAHLDLSDMELLAVAETLPTVDMVKKVDLHGNSLLSDKAVAQLLLRVLQPKLSSTLLELSIAGCTRAGPQSMERVVELVSDAFNLRRLDLSQVKIEHYKLLPLCDAISKGQTLSYVSLSGTGFGKGPTAFGCACVTTLLQGHVAELDLSWNQFSAEIFSCLGETLAKRKMVKKLNICNCSGGCIDSLSTPVNFYLEQLQMDSALTSLDLSMSHMDYRSALVLEDALQNHKSLKHLQLSDNPLGPRGLRSVLRCVATETNGLKSFDTSGSYGEDRQATFWIMKEVPSLLENEVFNMGDLPGSGSYNLQLHRPYHRALLRMLYRAAERFHLSPTEVFIVNSEDPFHHGTKKKDGTWEVPKEGEVSLSFNLERCLDSSMFKGLDRDFDSVIKRLLLW
eukprot:s6_g10.t1